MLIFYMFFACSEEEPSKSSDSGISEPTFENEEHLISEPNSEQCPVYWHAGVDNMIEGAFVEMFAPAYPYEIRGVSIDVIINNDYNCNSGGTIHLIAFVGDNPKDSEDIISFMQYNSIAPYSFPELENVVSTTITLDGTSEPETLEDGIYKFLATFDDPLLIENEQRLWVGFGIHNVEDICIYGCESSTNSYIINDGTFTEREELVNLGVVVGY